MRLRTLSAAAALAGAVMTVASAAYAADPMAATYANTVVSKDEATGVSSRLMFNKDGSYTGQVAGQDGKPVSFTGTWTLKDGDKTICLSAAAAPGAKEVPRASCSPLMAHNVGDSWKVTTDQKQTFDVSIIAGR